MAIVTATPHAGSAGGVPIVSIVLLTFLGVFAIAGGITLAGGGSVAGALGIGLFCAIWGGPGFGCMIGGAVHALRAERGDA